MWAAAGGAVEPTPRRSSVIQFGRSFDIVGGGGDLRRSLEDPRVDIQAQYEVPSWTNPGENEVVIELSIEGTLDELRLLLSSVIGLPGENPAPTWQKAVNAPETLTDEDLVVLSRVTRQSYLKDRGFETRDPLEKHSRNHVRLFSQRVRRSMVG